MKRQIKQVTRLASQLTDAKPEFVSLVGHGANQTPFRAVKAAAVIAAIQDKQGEDMAKAKSKKDTAAEISAEAEIQKAVFAAESFDSADKVTEYLESKGYTKFKVTEAKGGGFEVIAKAAEDFEGEIKSLNVDKGVVFHVGKLAEGKAPLETVEKTAEAETAVRLFKMGEADSAQIVKKYCDYYSSCYTPPQGKTLAEVLTEQYANGNFPAYWSLAEAFQTALFNMVKAGEIANIKTLTAEFGDMITSILSALSGAGVDVSAAKAAFLKEGETAMTKETKAAEKPAEAAAAEVAAKATADKADTAETKTEADKPADKAADAPADKTEKETPAAEPAEKAAETADEKLAATIAKAIGAAVAPFGEALKSLGVSIKETSEGLADIKEKVSKTGERVDELQNSRQTRKSADDAGVTPGSQTAADETKQEKTQKSADEKHAERMRKNLLGISG